MKNHMFSIIIPTLGRTTEVGCLLNSISKQTNRSFEVIIVDQNQDNRLDPIVQHYSADFPILHLKVDFRGAARARNYGFQYATGKVLNFADDDSTMCPNTLSVIEHSFKKINADALFGPITDPINGNPIMHFIHRNALVKKSNIYRTCIECNMFIKKTVFDKEGGFDDRLGVGTHFGAEEGGDLFLRLLYHDYKLYYLNKVLFHHPEKKEYNDFRRARSYAIGYGGFVRKHLHEYHRFRPVLSLLYFSFKALVSIVLFTILGRMNRARYNKEVFCGRFIGFKEWGRIYEK